MATTYTLDQATKELAGLTAAYQKATAAGDLESSLELAPKLIALRKAIPAIQEREESERSQAVATDAITALKTLSGKLALAFEAGVKSFVITPRKLEDGTMTIDWGVNAKRAPSGATGIKRPRTTYSIDGKPSLYRQGFIEAASALGSVTAKATLELPHGRTATDTQRTEYSNKASVAVDAIISELATLKHTVTVA